MIRVGRYPPGKRFGFTFVDDTDLSTRENTEPVYECLLAHGFLGAKTVWPSNATRNSAFRREDQRDEPDAEAGSTLQDPEYASFIRRLQAMGFEIALHGVASGNSTREEIRAGLERYATIVGRPPALNAFHRTNLDNLYCGVHKLDSKPLRLIERLTDRSAYEGHREGTPSFWGDIARDVFRYVRLPFHTIDEINTLRINPSMPFSDVRRPYVRRWFAASDGADVVRFVRLLAEPNVQRLADQEGVCIIYTHFAKGFAQRRATGYELNPEFVKTVRRVAARPDAWFANATTMLDRLSAIRSLALRHDGLQLEIQNTSDVAIDSVVLHLSEPMQLQAAGGQVVNVEANRAVLPRLEASASVTLRASRAGRQTINPVTSEIPRRERREIEYANYRGLVRGWMRDRAYYAAERRQQGQRVQ